VDWSDERYVRLYVRDTLVWSRLGWQGQAVLSLLLRRMDRAGITHGVRTSRDVAVIIGHGFPENVAKDGLDRLIAEGILIPSDDGISMPTYIDAQEASQSGRERASASRQRKRDKDRMCKKPSQNVTKCHKSLQNYTDSEKVTQIMKPPTPKKIKKPTPANAAKLAKNWQPNDTHRRIAADLGVDISGEAEKFRDHAEAHGRKLINWDAGFRNWMRMSVDFSKRNLTVKSKHQRNMEFLKSKLNDTYKLENT